MLVSRYVRMPVVWDATTPGDMRIIRPGTALDGAAHLLEGNLVTGFGYKFGFGPPFAPERQPQLRYLGIR